VESTESGISFAQFVLSLGTTAAVHFGDLPDPVSGERGDPNLIAAAQMIDLLALLQDKTRGNLDAAESKLLDDLLFDLRMRFVQAQQQPRVVQP
jgi:predicted ABC-type transport system involved in lysophospholipase L1 biosynthesis ATPase subunit